MLYPGEGGWAGNRAAGVESLAEVSETKYKLSGLDGSGGETAAGLSCSWQPCESSGFVLSGVCSLAQLKPLLRHAVLQPSSSPISPASSSAVLPTGGTQHRLSLLGRT